MRVDHSLQPRFLAADEVARCEAAGFVAVSLGPLSGWEDRLIERLREQRAA
jgi:hypothetical protein